LTAFWIGQAPTRRPSWDTRWAPSLSESPWRSSWFPKRPPSWPSRSVESGRVSYWLRIGVDVTDWFENTNCEFPDGQRGLSRAGKPWHSRGVVWGDGMVESDTRIGPHFRRKHRWSPDLNPTRSKCSPWQIIRFLMAFTPVSVPQNPAIDSNKCCFAVPLACRSRSLGPTPRSRYLRGTPARPDQIPRARTRTAILPPRFGD
jgi:hypothetical protein